jgi:error-prone DNA polymerase
MCYVKGLREEVGQAIVRERDNDRFADIEDLHNRVPELRKDEMKKLAQVGALNFIHDEQSHRRDALWQVERATRPAGPLIRGQNEEKSGSPLKRMTVDERLIADFSGTGLTIGRHPISYHRAYLDKLGALPAVDLQHVKNGRPVRVGGVVIVRQRPGTAKGFMFMSLEDETGIANIIVTPTLFDDNRAAIDCPFILIDGVLQNQDNTISVKARRIQPLNFVTAAAAAHDFH